jgi:hypothetical protein
MRENVEWSYSGSQERPDILSAGPKWNDKLNLTNT